MTAQTKRRECHDTIRTKAATDLVPFLTCGIPTISEFFLFAERGCQIYHISNLTLAPSSNVTVWVRNAAARRAQRLGRSQRGVARTSDCTFSVVIKLIFDEAQDETRRQDEHMPTECDLERHTWTSPQRILL